MTQAISLIPIDTCATHLLLNPLSRISQALLAVLFLSWSQASSAGDLVTGVGMSSAFAGRLVPGLQLGWEGTRFAAIGSTAGVRTSSYFYNAYQLEGLYVLRPGKFIFGDLEAGFGLGFFYASEGYGTDRYGDYTAGPEVRVSWKVVGPVFIAVDTLFGLRNPLMIIDLAVQDLTTLSIGLAL